MSNLFPKGAMLPLVILTGIISSSANATDISKVIRRVRSSVVTVVIYDKTKHPLGNGRGFFIDDQGHLITNYHVLSNPSLMGASSARIQTSQGHEYQIKMVVAEDREADLIKVLVDMPQKNIRFLKISEAGPIVEERVFVLGDFRSGKQKVHWGHVSAMEEMPPRGAVCQITVPIIPGLSGSPVINREGELVAVACGHDIEGQNLSYAIPTEQLLALKPKKNPETLLHWFRKIAGQPNAARGILHNSYVMVRAGHYTQALDFLKKIVQKNPRLSEAWFLSGYCHFKLDHYTQAVKSYIRALSLRSDYADAHFGLGFVYMKEGRYEQAVAAIKKVIEITPDSATAYYNLGLIYGKLGNSREEITALQQAIKIKPGYINAYYSLGFSYNKIGFHRKAIDVFTQVIRLKPDYAQAHFNLGLAYGNLRRYREAILSFQQAIKLKSDYAEAYFNLGLVYGKQDRCPEAIDAFLQGLGNKPDDPKGYFNLGLMYKKSDQHDKAVEAFEQAVKVKLDYAEARFELGLSYLEVGKDMAAFAEYLLLEKLDKDKAAKLYNLIMK